ncbi:MAG: hypothetical protein JSS27_18125 [Planctomycetes bacterium]|nr:hypothetical protein [Planctomycetota bacterium]
MKRFWTLLIVLAMLAGNASSSAAEFRLRDGDRVVLLGGTVIEREQKYGCWETMLTSQFPGRNIMFRNLGWSGDTVWGESRVLPGKPEDGYRALVEQVAAAKPTVVILGYGGHEALAGDAGLPKFNALGKRLFEMLEKTGARIVVLAPLNHEKLPAPQPDPEAYNKQVWHYRDALHDFAIGRDHFWVDLEPWLREVTTGDQPLRLTDDGVQLSPVGYLITAAGLENEMQLPPAGWKAEIDASGAVRHVVSADLKDIKRTDAGLTFRATAHRLPFTAITRQPGREVTLNIHNLPAGNYRLTIDGVRILEASSDDWAGGVAVDNPASLRQLDQLRSAIIKKNELFFHRWRPRNFTDLFGVHKHEPGQNAQEIPEFDTLVTEQEQRIAELRRPGPHRFELSRVAPTAANDKR